MKIIEILTPLKEDASGGGTASGAIATSLGAGFGKSIFMRRTPAPKKKKSKK